MTTGERCPHCGGIVATTRRGGDPVRAWAVHEATCPGLLRVKR